VIQKRAHARKGQILDATVQVIARAGTGAVTHRAVAKEASVPLAATTYYFSSREDLLASAFEYLANTEIDLLTEGINTIPMQLTPEYAAGWWASMIADDLRRNRYQIFAEYEMHLETARQKNLLEIHRRWTQVAHHFFETCMQRMGSKEPAADGSLVLSVIAGIQIGELADPTKHLERDLLGPLFRRLLHALVP